MNSVPLCTQHLTLDAAVGKQKGCTPQSSRNLLLFYHFVFDNKCCHRVQLLMVIFSKNGINLVLVFGGNQTFIYVAYCTLL